MTPTEAVAGFLGIWAAVFGFALVIRVWRQMTGAK